MILGEQQRPQGCITDLTFDAWFASELSAEARGIAQAHLASCPRCQQRQAALTAQRDAFLATDFGAWRPAPKPSAGRRPWAWALAAGAVSAAVVVASYARLHSTDVRQPERLKGTAHIGFFVQRGDRTERAAPVYIVHPGDRIRFVYTSPRPAYLAIIGLDARGEASLYFPSGDWAERVAAGSDLALNSAVELDNVLGEEKLFAVFCDAAFRTAEAKRQVSAKESLARWAGCRVDSITWKKERSR